MVAIVIIVYNLDARVFLMQIEAIRKFCKDEYKIEIFDNSTDAEFAEGIRYQCDIAGISYRKTQSASRNGSESHCFAAGVSYELLKDRYQFMLYLDHDCIPVKSFSVIDILGIKLMAGLGQQGQKKYFWVGCLLFNNLSIDHDLIDFRFSHELRLDSGGLLYKVIEKYGEENMEFFNEEYCELDGFVGKQAYYSMINNRGFIHWVNASNWEKNSNHEERINRLLNITKELIDKAE